MSNRPPVYDRYRARAVIDFVLDVEMGICRGAAKAAPAELGGLTVVEAWHAGYHTEVLQYLVNCYEATEHIADRMARDPKFVNTMKQLAKEKHERH